jgi:hypothetical protein
MFESYFNEIPKLKQFLEQTKIKINKLQNYITWNYINKNDGLM